MFRRLGLSKDDVLVEFDLATAQLTRIRQCHTAEWSVGGRANNDEDNSSNGDRKAGVKDALIAAAAAAAAAGKGDAILVSGGGMFSLEDMLRVAVYMSQVKDGDASEDVQPALKIHGRTYGQLSDVPIAPVNG